MIGEQLTDETIKPYFSTCKRKVTEIIIHCSATEEGKDFTVFDIDRWHKARKFSEIGYHFVIYNDGKIICGRELNKIGAHTTGHNTGTIGICYIGGLDKNRKPKDTRTYQQLNAMYNLVNALLDYFPSIKKVSAHYDYANKACPSFSVEQWLEETGLINKIKQNK